jgi:hypothetical protein
MVWDLPMGIAMLVQHVNIGVAKFFIKEIKGM